MIVLVSLIVFRGFPCFHDFSHSASHPYIPLERFLHLSRVATRIVAIILVVLHCSFVQIRNTMNEVCPASLSTCSSPQKCGQLFQSQLRQLMATKQSCDSAYFYDCCQVQYFDACVRATAVTIKTIIMCNFQSDKI